MRRGLWFVAGAGAGVYAVTRARRAAEAFTPDGLRDRLAGLAVGAQLLREEFTAGAVEREVELREQLGLLGDGPGQLTHDSSSPPQITQPQIPQSQGDQSQGDQSQGDQSQGDQSQTTEQKDDN